MDEIVIELGKIYTRETAPIQPSANLSASTFTGREVLEDAIRYLGHMQAAQLVAEGEVNRTTIFRRRQEQGIRPITVLNKRRKSYLLSPKDIDVLRQEVGPTSGFDDYDKLIASIDGERTYTIQSLSDACAVSRKSIERLVAEGMPKEDSQISGKAAVDWLNWRKNVYSIPELARLTGYGVMLLTEILGKFKDGSFEFVKLGKKKITYLHVHDLEKFNQALSRYRLGNKWQQNKFKGDVIFECLMEARVSLAASDFTLDALNIGYVGIKRHISHRFKTFEAALAATAAYIRKTYADDPQKLGLAERFNLKDLLNERSLEARYHGGIYVNLDSHLYQPAFLIATKVKCPVEEALTKLKREVVKEYKSSLTLKERERPIIAVVEAKQYYDKTAEPELEQIVINAAKNHFEVNLEKSQPGYGLAAGIREEKAEKKSVMPEEAEELIQEAPAKKPIEYKLLREYLAQVAQLIAVRKKMAEKMVADVLVDAVSHMYGSDALQPGQEPLIAKKKNSFYYDPSREAELEELVIGAAYIEFSIRLERRDGQYLITARAGRRTASSDIQIKPKPDDEKITMTVKEDEKTGMTVKDDERITEYILLEDYLMPVAQTIAKDLLKTTKSGYIPNSEIDAKAKIVLDELVQQTVRSAREKHHDIPIPKDLITDMEGKPAYHNTNAGYVVTLLTKIVNQKGYTLSVFGEGRLSVERK
ncbi:hypothetical protein J4206_05580 [Candidatus Woesearchaeota archaeon]|nr:hypothetical protein [Candidatus Woesearchaeota archaeon]